MTRFIFGSPFNHGLLLHLTSNVSGALTAKDLVSRAAPAAAKEDSHQNKEEKDKETTASLSALNVFEHPKPLLLPPHCIFQVHVLSLCDGLHPQHHGNLQMCIIDSLRMWKDFKFTSQLDLQVHIIAKNSVMIHDD